MPERPTPASLRYEDAPISSPHIHRRCCTGCTPYRPR